MVNPGSAKWQHDAGDPPGSESVLLREDAASGSMELFATYPAGHIFAPHWHSVNERIVLLEGRLAFRKDAAGKVLEPGGYAFVAAREVHEMKCVSDSKCRFYVYWDGKLDNHKPGTR